MKIRGVALVLLVATAAVTAFDARAGDPAILQSWQGDYPVAELHRLPENQRDSAVGFIADPRTFAGVWDALKPGEALPEIDFGRHLVLFARNTQFFNRINIAGVNLKAGVVDLLAMETMSAAPIEDKVAISLVTVRREGITGLRSGDGVVPIR